MVSRMGELCWLTVSLFLLHQITNKIFYSLGWNSDSHLFVRYSFARRICLRGRAVGNFTIDAYFEGNRFFCKKVSNKKIFFFRLCTIAATCRIICFTITEYFCKASGILRYVFLNRFFIDKSQYFQVARIVNYKQVYLGDLPRYAEALPKVLQDVLGVDPNSFPFLWYREYALEVSVFMFVKLEAIAFFFQEDQAIWRQRPLSDELQKVLEAQVSYLFDLRTALMEKLLLDLTIGVDTYLKVVRDAKNSEVPSKLVR